MKPIRIFALSGLTVLAAIALGGIEASFSPGGAPGMLAAPAMADDDDDDDDDGGGFGGGGGGGFGPRFSFGGDDDDDGPVFRRERRRAAPPPARRRAAQRRQAALPEFVAAGVTTEALGRIRAAGFSVLSERRLALLPDATVRVTAPRNLRGARARARLAELAPEALIDANTLYRPNARKGCAEGVCFPFVAESWSLPVCPARGAVGMIDTRVDASHPALKGRAVETASTRSADRKESSPGHGTEVATLLAGARAEPDDMKLVAVDAFHSISGEDRADAFDIVAAIDLLAARGAGVVNLSLAGPPNALLERAGQKAAERGVILVAAVGNDGPKAEPRFPAAYPWAVAVTALDAKGRAYAKAGRGDHVAFAAPGVRVELPDADMKPGRQRSGTSYAAPLVAAALSALKAEANGRPAKDIVATLASSVEDMGEPGRDPVFGWGALPRQKGCPSASRAAARE